MTLLKEVACVLADTSRSKAYIQEMVKNELKPAKCLLLGDFEALLSKREDKPGMEGGESYFDMNQPLTETLNLHEIDYEIVHTKDINDELSAQVIAKLPQEYIVYSGYGGAILKAHLFQMGKKWIHVHAGILPNYRGSTTAYYSLLDTGRIGATVIFLNEKIDEGDILAEGTYAPPEDKRIIDYEYEPYVRSLVLVKALKEYARTGTFTSRPQRSGEGQIYYIIHPVLKHLAILAPSESFVINMGI